jgi:signal transduction histidine kinase/ActR/RegA family two-component response regulator
VRSESLRNPAMLTAGALAVLACALIYFVFESGIQRHASDRAIAYTEQVLDDLRTLLLRVTEAESGQRGYLLTGDSSQLTAYAAAPAAIDALLQRLRDALSSQNGDPAVLVRLDQVAQRATARLAGLRQLVALQESGQTAEVMELLRSNRGQSAMASLREAVQSLMADETRRLNTRLQDRQTQQNFTIGVLVVGSGFAVLMLLAATAMAMLFARTERSTRAALQAAHDAAVSADRSKSQFLATASHDLRQPLHAMNLFISALRRRVSGDEATKLVANMASAAESMQMMFNALLDVSKLHAGAIEPAVREFPTEEVFGRLRNAFAAQAAAKGLVLDIADSSTVLRTDPVLLESILRNLISNAVRYTRKGEITVLCRVRDDIASIEVSDTGPGIPADQIERAFEEFQRLDTSNAAERGLGLGLAIVRRLARLLDLPIEIDSEVGIGTAFTVHIPLAASFTPQAEPVGDVMPSLAGRRVLLVDDDPLVRAALAREIADWGARITVVGSAEAALWALGSEPPDVAVVDRDLGEGSNGIELLATLTARFGEPIPAVVVTGATDLTAIDELRHSGIPWLTKPLDAAVLRAKVSELLAAVREPVATE